MARSLSAELDACMRDVERQPAYRVEIYDVRSTALDPVPIKINDVVLALQGATPLPEICGPRDFTDEIVAIDLTETAGDYLDSGIAASSLTFTAVSPDGSLDPLLGDPVGDGRWLRQGNVLVLREGDQRVADSEWPITFVGKLRGQVGADRNRTTGNAVLTGKASSREVDYLRVESTSQEFPQATPYSTIAEALAETDLGLDPLEVSFPSFSVRSTQFVVTQFLDASPLVSLAQLMLPDGYMPRFNGAGKLVASSGAITKGPTRSYEDGGPIVSIERPLIEANGPNEIQVIGLNPIKRQVLQDRQTLATASITTGFFSRRADIPVRWSDDGSQQAVQVRLEVDSSIADGVFGFGGERYVAGVAAADGGTTRGTIQVDGGLEANLVLASLVAGAWILAHAKSDAVVAFGAPAASGYTIPVGRIVEGAVGQTLYTILGRIGRGQYRVTGKPYEYVFDEISGTARVARLEDEDVDARTIQNQLLNSEADCKTVALRVLQRARAQVNARTIRAVHDLALEPDDVFSVGAGSAARRYMIRTIRRRLERGGGLEAVYDAFEVTLGVRP